MSVKLLASSVVMTALAALAGGQARAENWPQWRGPRGDSTSQEQGLPLTWSEGRGIAWKKELPGWGDSTPAVWNENLFLTTQDGDKLLAMKLHGKTGETVWSRQVGQAETTRKAERGAQKFHDLHNNASPSPVTDGDVVVFHFGNGDLLACDLNGEELWRHNLQDDYGAYSIWWGHANSPVLFDDLVISVCMQDPLTDLGKPRAASYLIAHDKRTGKLKWKSDRATAAQKEEGDSYTTPLLYHTRQQWQLIVMGGNQLDGYDPATGKRLWFLPGLIGGRTITGPTVGQGMVFATKGMRGDLLAVRLGRAGELTHRDVVWKEAEATPDTCCPVLWQDLLFTVSDKGIAKCFDAHTGNMKWKKRLTGEYKASPVAAEGRVYFLNMNGLTTVVAASNRSEELAKNPLDDDTNASLALANGRVYVRGKKYLYAIERR